MAYPRVGARRRADEPPAVEPTVLHWPDFTAMFQRRHRPGEHVAIVGPTGSGKTLLGLNLAVLLGQRKSRDGRPAHVVIFGNKSRDRTLSALGWPKIRRAADWPPGYGQEHVIVWPRTRDVEGLSRHQRQVFRAVMREIFESGAQTVYIDEIAYFEDPQPEGLGLKAIVAQYWQQGRSLDLTLVAATQRPRNVNVSMWSEPTWLLAFRLENYDDVKRVAELAPGGRADFERIHDRLGGHEFMCIYRPRGGERAYFVSRVE